MVSSEYRQNGWWLAVHCAVDHFLALVPSSTVSIAIVVDIGLSNKCSWATNIFRSLTRDVFRNLKRVVIALYNSRAPETMRGDVPAEIRDEIIGVTAIWHGYRRPGVAFEVTRTDMDPLLWQKDEDGVVNDAPKILVGLAWARYILRYLRASLILTGVLRGKPAVSLVHREHAAI